MIHNLSNKDTLHFSVVHDINFKIHIFTPVLTENSQSNLIRISSQPWTCVCLCVKKQSWLYFHEPKSTTEYKGLTSIQVICLLDYTLPFDVLQIEFDTTFPHY